MGGSHDASYPHDPYDPHDVVKGRPNDVDMMMRAWYDQCINTTKGLIIVKQRIEGKRYKHPKYGYYTMKRIESCEPGDIIDMGTFDGIDPRSPKQGENTRNVRLTNGYHYTETKGALVRVWDN